ncbi:MAG: T9SS type A sorting domain-containing protein [Candidatus Zixiibacteriota bacterium]|nr:MAG: T9SS type A sorting domain-containing protein [candidate division Zixibacteria bacterium]
MFSRVMGTGSLLLAIAAWAAPVQGRSLLYDEEKAAAPATPSVVWVDQTGSLMDDPDIPCPVPYGVQQTGMVNTSFDCFGRFASYNGTYGYPDYGWPQAGFRTPSYSGKDYLFTSALWVGGRIGSDTLVSTGWDGWSTSGEEFSPPNYPIGSVTGLEGFSDYSMRAVYTDTAEYIDPFTLVPHVPLNVKIVLRSHVWRNDTYEDIVAYDMVISNIGTQDISECYIGFYMDGDVLLITSPFGYQDDISGSIREHGIGYLIDNDGDPDGYEFDPATSLEKIFAFRLLASSHAIADTNFNWWTSSTYAEWDFGPRLLGTPDDPFFDFETNGLGTPTGDTNKYYMLSHPEWDYDQVFTASIEPDDPVWMYPPQSKAEDYTDGCDTKFLMSYGPFELAPDSSIRLIFAMFTADHVHWLTWNPLNLPDNPTGYLANLDFSDVLANAGRAEELSVILRDPVRPVTGLEGAFEDWDSVVVVWDPWVFDNYDGYDIFLSEVPEDTLPYPGLVPPWLEPQDFEPAASVGKTASCALTGLDPHKFYFAAAAHRLSGGTGALSGERVVITQRGRMAAPVPDGSRLYYAQGIPAALTWTDSTEADLSHYNIYRADSIEGISLLYKPFYSYTIPDPPLVPKDSFKITEDSITCYYFAMDPFASVDSGTYVFEDTEPLNDASYVITAVDKEGFESEFSSAVQACEVYETTRDILLITQLGNGVLAHPDTVMDFYDGLRSGLDLDIDVYCYKDTIIVNSCDPTMDEYCMDWRDLTRYEMVIVDGEDYDGMLKTSSESKYHRFEKYLLSGGKVAYFGEFKGMNFFEANVGQYYRQNDWFIQPYFGVDSLYFYHHRYYLYNSLPLNYDSCFGFGSAQPLVGTLPAIAFDIARQPFTAYVTAYWQDATPPAVACFATGAGAQPLYSYTSIYPETSRIDGYTVAATLKTDSTETYIFGFHLWYMELDAARELVSQIFQGVPTDAPPGETLSLPGEFTLRQNYPNPFNPGTVICFELPAAANVTLEIFNILGQRVNTLVDRERLPAGAHRIDWRGTDSRGERVASGIYLYRLTAGDRAVTKKMVLLK